MLLGACAVVFLVLTAMPMIVVDAGYCSSSFDSCYTCNMATHCGWDEALGVCSSGTSSGPNSGLSAPSWIWGINGCSSMNKCTAYGEMFDGGSSACESCVNAYGGNTCGWDGYVCRSGFSGGPWYGSSSAWYWGSSCPASNTGTTKRKIVMVVIPVTFILLASSVCACCYCRRRSRKYSVQRNAATHEYEEHFIGSPGPTLGQYDPTAYEPQQLSSFSSDGQYQPPSTESLSPHQPPPPPPPVAYQATPFDANTSVPYVYDATAVAAYGRSNDSSGGAEEVGVSRL